MKDVDAADAVFHGAEPVSNFCQDLEEVELANAGGRDKEFYRKMIEFCNEFCRFFAETDPVNLHNTALGLGEEAERAFTALVKEYPDNPWSYIGWGDGYLWPPRGTGTTMTRRSGSTAWPFPTNLIFDRDVVEERLEDVKEANRNGVAPPSSWRPFLNTLPVDLTFVDSEDTVRFFGESPARVFPRTRAIIGRKVPHCHPEKSLAEVKKVLEALKRPYGRRRLLAGTRGTARLHPLLPRPEPGRNLSGLPGGPQDITDIKKIEGEKRLL